MPEGAIVVRPLVVADLTFAAALHAEALPHGFFASLGQPYLRVYYRGFVNSPYACAFVAEAGGDRIGVLVGVLDCDAHRHFILRRHSWRLALRGALALVGRPRLAARFVTTRMVRYIRVIVAAVRPGGQVPDTPGTGPAKPALGLLSHIAVISGNRGSGVGEALVRRFVEEAGRRGVGRIELVTLVGSRGAAPFYERLGWQRDGVLDQGDEQYVKFSLELR